MIFEPIITSKINSFCKSFEIKDQPDGIIFEKFVNYQIMSTHQPDVFIGSDETFISFCVGGTDDMGIDGLTVKLNGILVKDTDEVDEIVSEVKEIEIEFIFIQSKYKEKFDLGEYNIFTSGIRDFLNDMHVLPMNEKIRNLLKVKDYIFSDSILNKVTWKTNPKVRAYYVSMTKEAPSQHIEAAAEQFHNEFKGLTMYDSARTYFINSSDLK